MLSFPFSTGVCAVEKMEIQKLKRTNKVVFIYLVLFKKQKNFTSKTDKA
jgi:hypothetical protein